MAQKMELKKGEKRFFHAVFDQKAFEPKGLKAVEVLEENGVEKIRVRGYASTIQKDRYGDIVLPGAFTKTIEEFMTNPIVLLQHYSTKPIGKVISLSVDEVGLFITADITENVDNCFSALKNGVLKGFSIGYDVLDYEYAEEPSGDYAFVIKELELMEISIVSIPANRLTLMKSFRMDKKNLEDVGEIIADGAEKIADTVIDGVAEIAEEVIEQAQETAKEVVEAVEEELKDEPQEEVATTEATTQEGENLAETPKAESPQSEKAYVSRKEFEAYKKGMEEIMVEVIEGMESAVKSASTLKKSIDSVRNSKGSPFVPVVKEYNPVSDAIGRLKSL